MGIKTIMMILATLSFSVSALADNHEGENKPFSITGDFGASLNFYGSEHAAGNTLGNPNNNHDDFNVDLIQINLEKNWSKSKLFLSIGYGSLANSVNQVTITSVNTLNVMQAYYHMTTSYGLGFTFGKFESPVGHETYNMMDNMQWNRSWGFLLAPFFSTGAKIDYAIGDMWNVGFIASNGAGSDVDTRDNNKTMAVVIDADLMEGLHLDLNYVTGSEAQNAGAVQNQISIIDFSAAYMINEMFDVALNFIDHTQAPPVGQDGKATSIAAYLNAHFGMYHLGLRYEQLSLDQDVFLYNNGAPQVNVAGNENKISSITVTAKAEIDQNAHVVLEYKMDSADDQVFVDSDGAPDDANSVLTLGLLYRF